MSDKTLIKYKILLKELGYTGKDMANMLGIKYSSYRSMTRKTNRTLPKWVKIFVIVHEILERKHRKQIDKYENKTN
ncbi:hypothetical protein AVT43_gp05 [Polaribacter phage P12002L]|uniref:Uncharacterized protein n=2 Tax=Incheonvirus TaxID=2976977 RepID=A0A0F7DD20_9CAUD|nr:hypothetical protein AVT42_gp05 [Polaribacter phage P12002S]YP_009209665.1 hypothetical protein AVT43_gp05 [Polaribacter phage P12002L]AKG94179.1 hypothetical protein P12002L_0005 [Polaribacter phage P12002L]AKG94261.1 hypothetical protein P12002S_0005 [Polaribacter phage P12002S]